MTSLIIDLIKSKYVHPLGVMVHCNKEIFLCIVINEFKKGYQPRAFVIKKHDGTIVADTTSILSRWEQFF